MKRGQFPPFRQLPFGLRHSRREVVPQPAQALLGVALAGGPFRTGPVELAEQRKHRIFRGRRGQQLRQRGRDRDAAHPSAALRRFDLVRPHVERFLYPQESALYIGVVQRRGFGGTHAGVKQQEHPQPRAVALSRAEKDGPLSGGQRPMPLRLGATGKAQALCRVVLDQTVFLRRFKEPVHGLLDMLDHVAGFSFFGQGVQHLLEVQRPHRVQPHVPDVLAEVVREDPADALVARGPQAGVVRRKPLLGPCGDGHLRVQDRAAVLQLPQLVRVLFPEVLQVLCADGILFSLVGEIAAVEAVRALFCLGIKIPLSFIVWV